MRATIYPPTPGNDPGSYVVPSPLVATVKRGDHYVNAAYQRDEPRHLRPAGRGHADGTCGGYAGLCGRCFDLQLAWHKQVARTIAAVTPPDAGEDVLGYAVRVRGRMLDTWPEAFSAVIPRAVV
jgi:hypothetical protein